MNFARITKQFVSCLGLAAVLGVFASGTAQALPVYLQAPTDAGGNITLMTGESVTVDLYLNNQLLQQTSPFVPPITGYGFSESHGTGLEIQSLSGNSGFMGSPFPNLFGQGWDEEFLPGLLSLPGPGMGPLPDVLLASVELIATEVGSFDLDFHGGVFFLGEYLPALFDVTSEITVNVVPEPGTWLLMATGLLAMMYWARRKNGQNGLIETA